MAPPSSATLDPSLALDNSMGAMLLGVIVSGVLHGITLLQAFTYWTTYKKDIWYLKTLVVVTVSFDTIHMAMISHTVYHYLISHFHDPDHLQYLTWTVLMEALFTGVNGGIVQTFYTLRIFRLSKGNYYLAGFIVVLILATTGCGLVWVILSMQMKTYRQLLSISPLTITINALSTTVDIMIALSLILLLQRSRTGFKRSDTIINKLIVFVVNTGALTTFCAISSLVCLGVWPNSLVYASFYFCIGRFYTNSFLATLNARKSFSSDVDETTNMMMTTTPPTMVNTQTSTSKKRSIAIRIDTSMHNDGEHPADPASQEIPYTTGIDTSDKYDDRMDVHHSQRSQVEDDSDDDGIVKAVHL